MTTTSSPSAPGWPALPGSTIPGRRSPCSRPWYARTRGAGGLPFHRLTATDDKGTSYHLAFSRGVGGGPGEWWDGELMLHPGPPHDLRWLDLAATPGAPAVRVDLSRPPDAAEVTTRPASLSAGEHLLHGVATRLLATAPQLGTAPLVAQDVRMGLAALRPGRLAGPLVDGLGEIIAALQDAGALSPLSPVPGQLATLCANLNVTGHGITAPPAARLPEPWLSMLAHYHRRKPRDRQPAPVRDGRAGLAVALPELDRTRIAAAAQTPSPRAGIALAASASSASTTMPVSRGHETKRHTSSLNTA